jgi:hypothetical protein
VIVVAVRLALNIFPVVFTQLVDEVKIVGAEHKSFAGRSFTQILKPQLAAVPAATLVPLL